MYRTLLVKRQKELSSVAKIVGGVEEVRYQAGRGTVPFTPVAAERQRKAVKFLLERGFTRPDALLDPQVLWRMAPYGGADAVQDTNQKLLAQLVDKDVFHRMAEAATFPGAVGTYQGADLLLDLNDGLFSELKQPRPTIDLYRRDLQRGYVDSPGVEPLVERRPQRVQGGFASPDWAIWQASWTRRRRRCAIRKRGRT